MSFSDLFPHVDEWTAGKLQTFLNDHRADDYQLLDLRQEEEFNVQHLPGARLTSVVDLQQRTDALDAGKTTIVYCRNGVRSYAVAQVLKRAGFANVFSLRGGFESWERPVATGRPSLVLVPYAGLDSAEAHALFAWQLEENARRFYSAVTELLPEPGFASIFVDLAVDEQHHKETIKAIWEGLVGRTAPEDFPQAVPEFSAHDLLEGGMRLEEALAWARSRSVSDLLDLAMALEINAYDHYLLLQRTVEDENVSRLFELLADEEGRHMRRLSLAIEELHLLEA